MADTSNARYKKLERAMLNQIFNHNPDLRYGIPPESPDLSQGISFKNLLIFGIVQMMPLAPVAFYATLYVTSGGMPALSYLIALCAILFSVLSFGVMMRSLPSSGSIFTYASKALCPSIGFIAGWLMLLQYLLLPDVLFIQAAEAINRYLQFVPIPVIAALFFIFVFMLSTRPLKKTFLVTKVMLVVECIVLAIFLVSAIAYVLKHPETSSFSLSNMCNFANLASADVWGAATLCIFSFLGFGFVAFLAEEADEPQKTSAKAMLDLTVVMGVLYVLTVFIASGIDCNIDFQGQMSLMQAHSTTGFYLLAARAGGEWLGVTLAVVNALALGGLNALLCTIAVSRLVFVMSRSGVLPKQLGTIDTFTNVPLSATVFVNIISLVTLFFLCIFGMLHAAELVNFGALGAYILLNISVIAWCAVRKQAKVSLLRAVVCPAIGALVTGLVFFALDVVVALFGWIWVLLGVLYYLLMTKMFKAEIDFGANGEEAV